MKKYGYFHMGRTYTIADRNEAWQISLLRGHRYLARKVGDNEIAFITNAFAFDKLDLKDPNVTRTPDQMIPNGGPSGEDQQKATRATLVAFCL